jgi:hypothetical protein
MALFVSTAIAATNFVSSPAGLPDPVKPLVESHHKFSVVFLRQGVVVGGIALAAGDHDAVEYQASRMTLTAAMR